MRALGMLQDAAAAPHRSQRRRETVIVIALDEAWECGRGAAPIAAPAFARGVCDNPEVAAILAGVARLVPRVNPRQAEVATSLLDEEGRDQPLSHRANPNMTAYGEVAVSARPANSAQLAHVSARAIPQTG